MEKALTVFLTSSGLALLASAVVLVAVLCSVAVGLLAGWILSLFASSVICDGLHAFGVNATPENLPAIFATVSALAAFFASTKSAKQESK